jgi:hypothetical protein
MRIDLGGKSWEVRPSRSLRVNRGYYDPNKLWIVYDKRSDPQEQLDTLIHEMIHASDTGEMIDEGWVLRAGTEIANALWKLGYRKVSDVSPES